MFTLLAKLLSILSSDTDPKHIALGISFALFAGFNSILSPFGFVLFALILFFRVNLAIFIALFAVFSGAALVLSAPMEAIGDAVLSAPSMLETWQGLYQSPLFRYVELNNSHVLGQLLFSIVMFIPVYLLGILLIVKYRQALQEFVNRFKIVQSLKASKFYQIYQSVQTVRS